MDFNTWKVKINSICRQSVVRHARDPCIFIDAVLRAPARPAPPQEVTLQRFSGGKKRMAENSRLLDIDNKFNAVLRSQAVIEFNLDGTIITANENFLNAVGYSGGEVVGNHHSMFVDAAESSSDEYREFWRKLNAGEFIAMKFRRIGKGGREVWIQASYNPVLDGQGKPIKVMKIATDITQSELRAIANEAVRQKNEAEQAHVVNRLGEVLTALSKGDLTVRIGEAFEGGYAAIRDNFNATVDSLRDALTTIANETGPMRQGAEEIAEAASDLSRRTEQQAASLEETAAALDEITSTVKSSAEVANRATTVATGAKADAERSGEVVRGAVEAMGAIEQSSRKITEIIGVIDEIAFQTNLLALNAGVEAARAGDGGRGFAVVAQEVRALAQRSAEAAKEIKSLISESREQVEKGVSLVGATGVALAGLVKGAAEIDQLISNIARASVEQSTGLAQVNTAVNEMDKVTQQNASMVDETSAAAAQLQQRAAELATAVGTFDIGGQSKAVGRIGVAEAKRHRPVQSPARAAQQKLRVAANGGDWSEF